MRLSLVSLALLPALMGGCTMQGAGRQTGPADAALVPVAFATLPGWSRQSTTIVPALRSFMRGCRATAVMPVDQRLGGAGLAAKLAGQAGLWRGVCAAARMVPPRDPVAAARFFETYFAPYQIAVTTKFSGYFEPVYDGAETRLPGYDVPVYGRPRDLVSAPVPAAGSAASGRALVPYASRAEIGRGAINGLAPVVAWVRNPVDAYMMQVQGAGRLLLPDGSMIELGFDGTNGRRYVPIGKLMVARRILASGDVTAQSISAWLQAHPRQAGAVMDANPNYVFFRRVYDGTQDLGAPGALGVPLTPGASIAVAGKAVPLGTPVYAALATGRPSVQRVMIAQDIDASAQGFEAADIFTGIGQVAAAQAASVARSGRLYILLPRPILPVRTASLQHSQPY